MRVTVLRSLAVNAEPEQVPLDPCPHCGAVHPDTVLRCPETDIMLPLAGRMLDGRFRLIACIGRGGMASVWLARNERVDRNVALKLIRPEVARDEDLVARFRAEARAAGRIGNPNICDILDSGRSPIGPYIVMELLEGHSLGELLGGGARLEPQVAVMLVREALRGLKAAHRAGIVHRDLKPENIFLHRAEGGVPMVKLMDFGVAKFTDGTGEARTEHGALLGTPEYMAPEQFRGAAFAEARTDLWAVGAILYRALTGRNAFGGPTVAATLLMVASDQPTPLLELAPDTPVGLAEIVERCLHKDLTRRFADVAELDAALAVFDAPSRDVSPWDPIGSEPAAIAVEAQVPSARTRLWSRRGDAGFGHAPSRPRARVAAIVAVAFVVGLGAWQLRPPSAADSVVAVAPSTGEGNATTADSPADAPPDPSEAPRTALGDTGGVPRSAPTGPVLTPSTQTPPPPPIIDMPRLTDEAEAPDGRGIEDAGATDVAADSSEAGAAAGPRRAGADSTFAAESPPDPPGVVRVDRWVALTKSGPTGTLEDASAYCQGLAASGHLGIRRWEVPNPAVAARFAGAKGLRKGRHWTSAVWRGKALSIAMPGGKKQSVAATDRRPRALCIARWP